MPAHLLKNFVKVPAPPVPENISALLKASRNITPTEFSDKNLIITDKGLQSEIGFTPLPGCKYLVSMVCPMPDISMEMINWWFWWHPQASIRYQLWFPGEHISIGYKRSNTGYFTEKQLPTFSPNTQYPNEKIGDKPVKLCIKFVSPEEFGFDPELMKKNHVAGIVCGHVGVSKCLIMHTEMAHIFFKTNNGLVLVSRFWLGQKLKSKTIRNKIFTENVAHEMAEHCCREYRSLAQRLPIIYADYN